MFVRISLVKLGILMYLNYFVQTCEASNMVYTEHEIIQSMVTTFFENWRLLELLPKFSIKCIQEKKYNILRRDMFDE